MSFSPIQNERLSDKVVRVIMDQIKNGSLKPGEKLPNELDLADELGVSRGILREALTILQARNYICRKPKDGTIINPKVLDVMNQSSGITLKEGTYSDLIEMRICLEQRIVEKIIDTATNEEIDELFDLISVTDNKNRSRSIDHYFHYRLAELSHNAMFVNFIDSYYDVIDEVKTHTTKHESRREEIYNEHLNIVQALKERDKEKAKAAVVQHLKLVLSHIKSK
ncbi:MAG: FadR family transcriptional regulator [Clostridiales bacterium]|jgi:GntR family transcriptional repressor for pyruvate dehydrogenase complex|nr:FadR family transcriptional regulator [Clostridiales bacterium]